ncbi:MAG: regulatory signaling modulator protein AmpE [Gammaproteobacteria bacterium]
MNFLALVVGLLLDLALRKYEYLRGSRWFRAYFESLASLAQATGIWRASLGVLVIVMVPTIVTLFVGQLLAQVWIGFGFAFGVLLVLLTLGPHDLHTRASEYLEVLRSGRREEARELARELLHTEPPVDSVACAEAITRTVFAEANDRLYGILFWFALLGPAGAVLYRSTDFLRRLPAEEPRSTEFIAAVARLHGVLAWIPAHLAALGYGLSGSFENAVSELRTFYANCTLRFHQVSDDLLICAGLGALGPDAHQNGAERLRSALVLVRRTLIIWMAVYTLITLIVWAL